MSALRSHIQEQQNLACRLCGLLDAMTIIDYSGDSPEARNALTTLLEVALPMAREINARLDFSALPDGDDR